MKSNSMKSYELSELPTASEKSDDDLISLVKSGQTQHFAVLMRRYNQRLYRISRGITRDESESEDVVQQAFVSAFQNLDAFAGRASFATWLTKIAVNEALGRVRKQQRAGGELVEIPADVPAPLAEGPEVKLSNMQMTHLLEATIEELPSALRIVLVMRDVQELTTSETAELLDVTVEVVRVRLHRARASLRQNLLARFELGGEKPFSFAGFRCDRMVAGVFAKLAKLMAT